MRAFEPAAIPWGEIAFKTSFHAIRDWVRRRHPEVGPGGVPAALGVGPGLELAARLSRGR